MPRVEKELTGSESGDGVAEPTAEKECWRIKNECFRIVTEYFKQ